MTQLGTYIRQRRASRNISLREFARRLNLSPSFISDIELGRRHPSDEALASIARLLGVGVGELQAVDDRPPLDDLKRVTESDPLFSHALRTMLDRKMTGDQLLEMIADKKTRRKRAS